MTTRTSNGLYMGVLQPRAQEGIGWYARVLSERDWASQIALVDRFVGLGFTRAVNDIGGGKISLDADDRLFTDRLPVGESTPIADQGALWQIIENGVIRAEFIAEDLKEDVIHPESGLRTTEISGRGIGAVLDWAKVLPAGLPTPSKMTQEFTGQHPMTVFTTLLAAAQNDGYLTFVSRTFDAATDSAGNAWGSPVDLSVNAGESLLDLLNRWCDAYGCVWTMRTGFVLEVLQDASASRHLENEVVFTAHRDQTEHSRAVSRREIANVVYAETTVPAGVQGQPDAVVVAIASDGASQSKWRKRALWLSAGDSGGSTAASMVANATLGLQKDAKQSRTIKIDPTMPGRKPFEDFDANDWVAVELEAGATDSEARRVMAISVDIDDSGYPAVELTLQSRFENRQIRLQKTMDKLGGAGAGAQSSSPISVAARLGASRLGDLGDIDVTGAAAGQVLTFDGSKWVDAPIPAQTPSLAIDQLTDVDTAAVPPSSGQALVWDSTKKLWVPGTVASGGGGGGSADAMRFRGAWNGTPMKPDKLTFESGALPLGAVNTGGTWTVVDDADSTGGTLKALKAPRITSNGYTSVAFTVNYKGGVNDPIKVRYWVSSENGYDWLWLDVDGVNKMKVSGPGTGWVEMSFTGITTGSHTFKFAYSKDGSGDVGQDTGWISSVTMLQPDTSDPYGYGHVVSYDGRLFQLVSGNGASAPGTDGTWQQVSASAPGVLDLLPAGYATQAVTTNTALVKGAVVAATANCRVKGVKARLNATSGKTYRLSVWQMSSDRAWKVTAQVGSNVDVASPGTVTEAVLDFGVLALDLTAGTAYAFCVATTDSTVVNLWATSGGTPASSRHLSKAAMNGSAGWPAGVTFAAAPAVNAVPTQVSGEYALAITTVDR